MKHEEALERGCDEAIVIECDLAEPPEKVWRALTTPALVAEWLMPNDMRAEVGARFSFSQSANAIAGSPSPAGPHAHAASPPEKTSDAPAAPSTGLDEARSPRTAGVVVPQSTAVALERAQKARSSDASEVHERTINCEVLESKPPRRLSYRWREEPSAEEGDGRALESVVTFVLTGRSDGGTHLRVVHDEFELTRLEPTAMQTVTFWPRFARRRRPLMRRRRPFTATTYLSIHSRTRRAA